MKKLGSLGYIESPEIERGDNHKSSLQAIKFFDLVLKKKLAIRKKIYIEKVIRERNGEFNRKKS